MTRISRAAEMESLDHITRLSGSGQLRDLYSGRISGNAKNLSVRKDYPQELIPKHGDDVI